MQARIVLIKSILTACALLFAVVLPSLALTAWFSERLADPVKARLFTIHRWIGRAYLVIVFTVGVVYCLVTIGIQGYDQRVFTHSGLGLAVVALLTVKVLTVRGKIPPLSDHLPKLGSMLAVLTIGIFLTSAFWYFRIQAANAAPTSPAYPATSPYSGGAPAPTGAATSPTVVQAAPPALVTAVSGGAATSGAATPTAPTAAPAQASSPAGKAIFEQQCSQCHATARATSSPRSREAWAATIQRMVSQNGANISPSDQAAILDYLSSAYGTK